MPDWLIPILALSVLLALWSFRRAYKLHDRIESIHPGFNHTMRKTAKRRR